MSTPSHRPISVTTLYKRPNSIPWPKIPKLSTLLPHLGVQHSKPPTEPDVEQHATNLRVEEAYREAVRHAYPYIRLFGAQCHRSVTIAVPDQSATTAYEVLNSLIEQVSWLFGCNNALNPRTKLEMMKIVGRLRLHIRPEPYPLVCIVNIDRALDDADTHGFIQALRDQVILQHAGQLVFYTGSDISARVDFPPPTPWRPEGEEVHSS
ncbi:hypothetical protein ANO14919_057570 [Xylariales sp. No.14919]|nr:hypothetical protein ANO14919_057570 [Xylariales sp. No.14919]